MMMRAVDDTMILSPLLIWTKDTVDLAIGRIMTALDLAERDLRKM
jgi:putrescine---pyruvate transaminase